MNTTQPGTRAGSRERFEEAARGFVATHESYQQAFRHTGVLEQLTLPYKEELSHRSMLGRLWRRSLDLVGVDPIIPPELSGQLSTAIYNQEFLKGILVEYKDPLKRNGRNLPGTHTVSELTVFNHIPGVQVAFRVNHPLLENPELPAIFTSNWFQRLKYQTSPYDQTQLYIPNEDTLPPILRVPAGKEIVVRIEGYNGFGEYDRETRFVGLQLEPSQAPKMLDTLSILV